MKRKILVSSCLLGQKVRYNNGDAACYDPRFLKWLKEGRMIGICPEVYGGLPVPRPASQRQGDKVVTSTGVDVTCEYEKGAQAALSLAKAENVIFAILKQNSPSCGSSCIYDGTFTGTKKLGQGKTTELLRQNGIKVFGEDQLDEVEREIGVNE
ncbi:DUF523 domain-containing protein [Clostridium sp. Mt-5]|uniref:DUF523 domain-containing protein n=1 Tax=Clostridium moutaii TaxID=3240932 RepID=A0ABV4BN42_9CLOT